MKLSESELIAAIEAEETSAINWADGPLADVRSEAWRRYNSEPFGNEVEGRSQVVTSNVRDAVLSCMPSLARIFLSGDEIGRFEPVGPDDNGYEQESDVVNWYLMSKNPGYDIGYATMLDSLVSANSYVKAWWQTDSSIKVERYKGLSDDELMMLMQDSDVSITEHTEYPAPMADQGMMLEVMPANLHDVTVERKNPDEYVKLCAAPSNEILVSANHREVSLADADFVQHRRDISIGELRDLGYKVDDNIGDDVDDRWREESAARDRYDRYTLTSEDASSSDPSRRRVTLRETWIRLGDDKGAQTLWRVCLVGKTVLHKEEADLIPIACFCPLPYPHSHAGDSLYTLLTDIERIDTTILRQYLDNLYLSNNGRMGIDINKVNLDDLLVSRPGGVVRIDGVPGEALMPIVVPDVGPSALQAMERIAQLKENRIGMSRVSQGQLDSNVLNRTATGASLMVSAGQARLELVARCLANGFKDLYLITHALAQKHSTKPLTLKLRDDWVTVNPREWVRRTDFSLSVALGTGAPEQQMAKLQMVGQFMQQGAQVGLVTRENMYNWATEFLRAAGYRSAKKFVTQPDPSNQPQPNKPPEVMAAEVNAGAIVQAETIKQQGSSQAKQVEMQARMQADASKAQNEMVLAERKMVQDAELAKYQADLNAETKWKEKLLEVAGNLLAQQMAPEPAMEADPAQEASPESPQMGEIMAALTQAVGQLAAITGAPRRIVRGPDGRAMGVTTEMQ